ncbi:MAG: DegT/DnrJ/EryC1/StrS family aminotransferase [Bacillus sp. (in: Bacteria)]|nr:DegT/DnrJ/EryC1/StrS family aminotransferase [Bacillus sp. (in: firmicutes)]MCM1425503.1 DegT/DnrJ/EryC1/StrS family aminotransferase [Eubacterium sp.]
MEFRDLKTQYLQHKEAMDSAVGSVLLSGHFIGGAPVARLEEELAQYVGVKHCITCGNGTDALQLALMAWDLHENDAVFVPDFTFFSTGEVVPWVKAVPIFVDVDKDTFNISSESLEKAIQHVLAEKKLTPKAVIPVNLFGQPADFPSIRKIAEKYDLLLLEDAAQGFGGSIDGKKACSFGDIATTSFFPMKPLGCYGDGGAVFTDNDEWAELIRSYKVHGKGSDKYDNVRIGINSRLDTIQAAVLLEKLKFFDEEVERCNEAAMKYTELLKDVVITPTVLPNAYSSWAQYTVRFADNVQREKALRHLQAEEIPTAVYYQKPMHLQKAFQEVWRWSEKNTYEVTEKICDTCLSLPMHPYMQQSDIERICGVLKKGIV